MLSKCIALILIIFINTDIVRAESRHEELHSVAKCVMSAAEKNNASAALVVGLYRFERDTPTDIYENSTAELLGPMKINADFIPLLAEKWGMKKNQVTVQLTKNLCAGIRAASWFLEGTVDSSESIEDIITHYYTDARRGDLAKSFEYSQKVIETMLRGSLLEEKITKANAVKKTEWLLLIYDDVTMVKDPKNIQNLNACFESGKKMFMKNTRLRYQCLEPLSGRIYSPVTKTVIRKQWMKGIPKYVQTGKIAPWINEDKLNTYNIR